jgi:hypothetical protein
MGFDECKSLRVTRVSIVSYFERDFHSRALHSHSWKSCDGPSWAGRPLISPPHSATDSIMTSKEAVINQILAAFGGNEYPGDNFLCGSFEGCEAFEETAAFKGKTEWGKLDSGMLDARSSALSFFSEGAFRFFLPAFLIADLRGELLNAQPLFHLTGFSVSSIQMPAGSRVFTRKTGGSTLMNPRRYGAMTFADYARYRLSVFTREETRAIVAYLNCTQETDTHGMNTPQVVDALNAFWLDRAEHAPSRESLKTHLREENEFLAHLLRKTPDRT